jgi:hypothetical protein
MYDQQLEGNMAKLNMLKQMGKKKVTKGYRDDTMFDFGVKRERLHLTNGQDTGIDALYRGDNGKYLSSVSPKYFVTTHKTANDFVESFLAHQNISYEVGHTAVSSGNGTRFFREFRFPSMKFVPGSFGPNSTALDGGAKDEYCPTIIARNSYDRSSKLDFYYGGFRFICGNGVMIGDIIQRISIKHNVEPDYKIIADGFLSRIEQTIEGFKATYEKLNTMSADPFLELLLMETLSKKAAQAAALLSNGLIELVFDGEGNIEGVTASKNLSAYALMTIASDVASHSVRKFHRALAMQRQVARVFEA